MPTESSNAEDECFADVDRGVECLEGPAITPNGDELCEYRFLNTAVASFARTLLRGICIEVIIEKGGPVFSEVSLDSDMAILTVKSEFEPGHDIQLCEVETVASFAELQNGSHHVPSVLQSHLDHKCCTLVVRGGHFVTFRFDSERTTEYFSLCVRFLVESPGPVSNLNGFVQRNTSGTPAIIEAHPLFEVSDMDPEEEGTVNVECWEDFSTRLQDTESPLDRERLQSEPESQCDTDRDLGPVPVVQQAAVASFMGRDPDGVAVTSGSLAKRSPILKHRHVLGGKPVEPLTRRPAQPGGGGAGSPGPLAPAAVIAMPGAEDGGARWAVRPRRGEDAAWVEDFVSHDTAGENLCSHQNSAGSSKMYVDCGDAEYLQPVCVDAAP